jgi:hypothetical protein
MPNDKMFRNENKRLSSEPSQMLPLLLMLVMRCKMQRHVPRSPYLSGAAAPIRGIWLFLVGVK